MENSLWTGLGGLLRGPPCVSPLLETHDSQCGVSKGEYNGELEIDMSSLTQNKTYTVALEWYQKDAWLLNRSNFSAEGTGLEVNYLTVQKHTHDQNKTHLIYYHTLTIQFTKSVRDNATLNIKFEIGYPLLAKYPNELKDDTFFSSVWDGRSCGTRTRCVR